MKIIAILLAVFMGSSLFARQPLRLQSPDRQTTLWLSLQQQPQLKVIHNNQVVFSAVIIDLQPWQLPALSADLSISAVYRDSVNDIIIPPVPQKRARIPEQYNQLTIRFRQPYSLVIRAYNDGVAYRWLTHFKDSVYIKQETALFLPSHDARLYIPVVTPREDVDRYHSSFEEPYSIMPVNQLKSGQIGFTPVLLAGPGTCRVVITESDLLDYPGMFLGGTGTDTLAGVFAPYPKRDSITGGEFPQAVVTERAPYIAILPPSAALPWRVMAIADSDRNLPENDLVYRLASPSRIANPSWIQPGRGTDEWIIGINLFQVPFRAGINTATYKYYIDFARQFGLQRIMLDAGWSSYSDLFQVTPGLDMDSLSAYAREKGIKLCLWTLASTLSRQLEPALQQFKRWGVDFIMTDFMDRDDQQMVRFYSRVAEACARQQIMVMFHGAFKPAGFGRTWPNAVTREAVLGSEYNIWSNKATPEHNCLLPFIRMLSGPLDYEPGLLNNATREGFRTLPGNPMSQGTRCQQLAMFVIYDSPVQFFSGNPSQGLREPDFMNLLGHLPVTWDTTCVLQAQLGEYLVTARRKGQDWYIAGMTNWTARDISVSGSFLEQGNYRATICSDGINADRNAMDYQLREQTFKKGDHINLHLAPGGGFLIRLIKQ